MVPFESLHCPPNATGSDIKASVASVIYAKAELQMLPVALIENHLGFSSPIVYCLFKRGVCCEGHVTYHVFTPRKGSARFIYFDLTFQPGVQPLGKLS